MDSSIHKSVFESFANSERYKTVSLSALVFECLRALLIQKDTKLSVHTCFNISRLRALLIQKDTKLRGDVEITASRLRALLIQKDTKQFILNIRLYSV